MDIHYKTLPKRHKTKHTGIYFKEIQKTTIDEKGRIKSSIVDKMYCIQYKDIDGKWKMKSIGKYSEGIRENYCKQKRIEILNNTNLGEQPDIIKKKQKKNIITLNSIFELYKSEKISNGAVFKSTEKNYNAHIKKIFGDIDIDLITTDSILKFRDRLRDKQKSDKTISVQIALLKTLFNFAITEEVYHKPNPTQTKKLKEKKIDNSRDRYLTINEINQLKEGVNDNFILKLFVELSLSTGGRLETILNIQKKDINLSNHTITLKDLKNNSTYTGFLTEEVVTILKTYTNELNVNSYVIGGKNTKFPTRTIQRQLKSVIDEKFNIGLDVKDTKNRAVIHTLRHTFASHLAINGTPIFTIQKLMNHSDIKMTMRYAKLAPDSGKDMVKGLYK